jgi:dihydroorotase
MSVRPARIGGVQTQGPGLESGAPAHVCGVDASARWIVDPDAVASKSRNTPYASMELPGSVRHVIFGGIPTVIDGVLA